VIVLAFAVNKLNIVSMALPRNASTVVLLRPGGDGGFEILLTRRPQQMRFLGGFYVFPGGVVHPSDYSAQAIERCRGLSGTQASKILHGAPSGDVALGHWVAVVRELFEEVGILLCHTQSGEPIQVGDGATKRRLEQKRRALVRKQLDIGSFLESENLFCDLSRTVYFDHWITPDIYSMRFDTRFYMAALPGDQEPLARSEEVTHSLWIRPGAALARMDRENFTILPPTTIVLERLARLATWEQLRAEFHLP
jgi:8-oxo-dGTP pyrophosphatase MutT (NUDIX family)